MFKKDFEKGQMSRDMTIFVDDDGKAYHIYSSEENSTTPVSYTHLYNRVWQSENCDVCANILYWRINYMDKYIFDKKNGLWYELQGDYYIPVSYTHLCSLYG